MDEDKEINGETADDETAVKDGSPAEENRKRNEKQNLFERVISALEKGEKKIQDQEEDDEEYGDLSINIFSNSGQIYGDITQAGKNIRPAGGAQYGREGKIVFHGREDLDAFMNAYANSIYIPVLITLLVLKAVPKAYLVELAERLFQKLYRNTAEGETEKPGKRLPPSMSEIENKIFLDEIKLSFQSEAGLLSIDCLMLGESQNISGLLSELWLNHTAIRKDIIEWLLEIMQMGNCRKYILYQGRETLAELSAVDFSYAKENIIPQLARTRGGNSLACMVVIFKRLLKMIEYRENADALLTYRCEMNQDFYLNAALRLYDSSHSFGFYQALKKSVRVRIVAELEKGIELDPMEWLEIRNTAYIFEEDSRIPFSLLQGNREAGALYMEILAELFGECKTRKDKLRFGYYFCNLLSQDYYEEGPPLYVVWLISGLRDKKSKTVMRPLLHYVWGEMVFREVLTEIIFLYVKEMSDRSGSWTHMKPFFRELAFTGNQENFVQVLRMLDRIERDRTCRETAGEIKQYLLSLLERQRQK